MILTRTPFRVTLGGGGTDLPSYYEEHGGFIFAMALDKYMYVVVNDPKVGHKIRLHYSRGELVDDVSELRHPLAREALKLHGLVDTFEVASIADLPAGTGLGSSSSYVVGLLNALHHYKREYVSLRALAEEACHLELDILGERIGKQDQYMAVFGGLTVLQIDRSGEVAVRHLQLGSGAIADFVARTHIYYTGTERDAKEVLVDQDRAMTEKTAPNHARVAESLHKIKDVGHRILESVETQDFDRFGLLLDEHWQNKKRLSDKVSFGNVDAIYDDVRKSHHVLGGKVIGAGGGGFLMLYCERDHIGLERHMASLGMSRLHYTIESEGTKVMAQLGTGAPRARWSMRPPG